jgi:hypothetical protein
MRGADLVAILICIPSVAKQAAEKGIRGTNQRSELLQGLKPNVNSIGFIGPAEAVPLLQSI